jgi:hypothetical protein
MNKNDFWENLFGKDGQSEIRSIFGTLGRGLVSPEVFQNMGFEVMNKSLESARKDPLFISGYKDGYFSSYDKSYNKVEVLKEKEIMYALGFAWGLADKNSSRPNYYTTAAETKVPEKTERRISKENPHPPKFGLGKSDFGDMGWESESQTNSSFLDKMKEEYKKAADAGLAEQIPVAYNATVDLIKGAVKAGKKTLSVSRQKLPKECTHNRVLHELKARLTKQGFKVQFKLEEYPIEVLEVSGWAE